VKVILKELGANNIVPTPDQIRTYTALLEKGFEPETVLLAAVQCARKRKNSFEDLVWMLDNWDKAGVRTRAQADKYVLDMQQATREVRALLEAAGLTRRPTMDDLDR
jgi:DNA replication protein DnaD